jgi:hypothetical protein
MASNQTNINVAQNSASQIAVGGSNFLIQSISQSGINVFSVFRKLYL